MGTRLDGLVRHLIWCEKIVEAREYNSWHAPFYNEEWEERLWLVGWVGRGMFADLAQTSGGDTK